MAYMSPREYLNFLTSGRGGRFTAYPGPNGALEASGSFLNRRSPNKGWRQQQAAGQQRRAKSGSYGLAPPPARGEAQPTALQRGLQDLEGGLAERERRGAGQFVEDVDQGPVWGTVPDYGPPKESPMGFPSSRGTAAMQTSTQGQIGPAIQGQVGPLGQPAQDGVDAGGPQSFLGKIGGFFGRPGVAEGLTNLGAGISAASSRPGGSFWEGLGEGGRLAVQGENRRQMLEEQRKAREEAKRIQDEDRAAQKRVNEAIQEITGGWDENTTLEQRVSDLQRAANVAFGNADAPLGRGLLEEARDIGVDPAGGSSTSITNFDQIRYRAPDGSPTRGRKLTITQANGEVIQIFEYLDKEVLQKNLDEDMGDSEAQINAWRTGGRMADPAEETRLGERAKKEAGQRDMSSKMAYVARDAAWSLVIDPDTGERVDLDFHMAGAVPIAWDDDGNITDWEKGEVDDLRFWQSFFGDVISNAGSERVGFGKKLFNSIVRTKLPTHILEAYTEALNFINPTVRFLSGAQMTNQEAMRYYNALLPMPGDSVENIRRKRRKRDVLTAAMGGEGITDAQVREARELLGIDPDAEMNHLFSQFGREDETGSMAMNYYLAILDDKIGATNTFTSDQMRQMGDNATMPPGVVGGGGGASGGPGGSNDDPGRFPGRGQGRP